MQNMNNEAKHNSYVSSNIVPVRTPNNSNDTIENNNQTLPDQNDTQYNTNTNSPDVIDTSGLRKSTRVRKPPS